MQWWITQDASTLIRLNMVEFMVVKNDVHCSKSHIVWIEQNKRSFYCGFHLPWEKYSQGDVAITQNFILTLRYVSYFTLFFNVELFVIDVSYKQYALRFYYKYIQISEGLTHVAYDTNFQLFVIGSFPFQLLEI